MTSKTSPVETSPSTETATQTSEPKTSKPKTSKPKTAKEHKARKAKVASALAAAPVTRIPVGSPDWTRLTVATSGPLCDDSWERAKTDTTLWAASVEDVKARGILQPITITTGGIVVMGRKRYHWASEASAALVAEGRPTLSVEVRTVTLTEEEAVGAMLAENFQRVAPDLVAERDAALTLFEANLTDEQVAARLRLPKSRVAAHRTFGSLPAEVRRMVDSGEVSLDVAAAVAARLVDESAKTIAAEVQRLAEEATSLDVKLTVESAQAGRVIAPVYPASPRHVQAMLAAVRNLPDSKARTAALAVLGACQDRSLSDGVAAVVASLA